MNTRQLGPLRVSVVGLGCNNFGRRIDAEATKAVVDAALEVGVTFFDTADVYGNRGGSETILGELLQGRRDQVVLATKWGAMLDRDDQPHGARGFVRSALEASLQRLQTDHVDLYQHHQEDRQTPLEETFAALKELVDEGKILAVGTSNYEPDLLEEAALVARNMGVPYVSEQSEYSWLKRDAEGELLPTCERLGLGFIPYFPLASGLLTGKVSRDRPPAEGTRLHGAELDEAALDRVERYRAWAEARDLSLLDVAIGGLAAVRPVASVIAGATKPEQVRANAAAGAWEPTPDELGELRAL
jgi:aryl-alcohol dehydrogenase-like predicted oxidoreductase